MSATITYTTTVPQFHDTKKITLDKILQELNGAAGGGGAVSDGVVDPVVAPTDGTITNWYVNTNTGTAWVWPAGGAAWQQIV